MPINLKNMQKNIYLHPIVIILLLIHAIIGILTINSTSYNSDEPGHLTAGYTYLSMGDYRMGHTIGHPPFAEMWAALPLLVINPEFPTDHPLWEKVKTTPGEVEFPISEEFLYKSKNPDLLVHSGRYMILLFSLMLGITIYFWAKEMSGHAAGLIALFLWCFFSGFLAHGTVITTDMAATLFYFMSMYLFWRWWKNIKSGQKLGMNHILLFGISTGLAIVSKYNTLIIFPVICFIFLWLLKDDQVDVSEIVKLILWVVPIISLILLLVYQFKAVDCYFDSMRWMINYNKAMRVSFLMGKYNYHGSILYFPVVFLIKTPLPFIAFFAATLFVKHLWTKERIQFLLLPACIYFLVSCFSSIQIGHRHILLVYPFLIVWISGLFNHLKKYVYKVAGIALLFWYAYGTIAIHPWHMSYFNELIGSPGNAYKYLLESNIDWGLGLKALAKYMKEHKVQTIYFSPSQIGSDPHYYGINYVPVCPTTNMYSPWTSNHRLGSDTKFYSKDKDSPVLFAISPTNLQSLFYTDKNAFSWLKEIPYETIIARSIFVYNLSKYPAQLRKMLHMANRHDDYCSSPKYLKAEEYLKNEQYNKALALYARLDENMPITTNRFYIYRGLATAYAGLGLWRDSLGYTRKMHDISGETENAIITIASPYWDKPELFRAGIKYFEGLDRIYPKRWWVYANLGTLNRRLGNIELANKYSAYSDRLKK